MPHRSRRPGRAVALTSLAVLGLAVAGCASDANPVRDLAVSAGITGGEPKPAPDFISRTRADTVDYMPIGDAAPKRRYRARNKDDVAKAEAELNQTRQRNETRGVSARRAGAAAPAVAPPPVRPPS